MPSIFDLMPASFWPVQPFIPQADPTQPPAWGSTTPGWTPVSLSPPPIWPPGENADARMSDWDQASWEALAAQSGAPRDPGSSAIASSQMLADAKRVHDFVRWMAGPPSAPSAQSSGGDMLPASFVGALGNGVAASANAAASLDLAAPADDPIVSPGSSEQQPALSPAFGNSNIVRQGARARASAATRAPLDPTIGDFLSSIPRGIVRGLANTAVRSGEAAQIEMQQPLDGPSPDEATELIEQHMTGLLPRPQGVPGQYGETVGEFLGTPMSYLGPGALWTKFLTTAAAALTSEAAGQVTKNTWAEPYARIGGATLGGILAGSLRRAPAAASDAARDLRQRSPAVSSTTGGNGAQDAPAALNAAERNAGILYNMSRDTLQGLDPANPLLDYRPNGVPTVGDRRVLHGEIVRIRKQRGAREPEENHWFVQELRSRFQQAGIDPDDFTTYMSFKDHRAKGTGVHAREFSLNRRWRDFFQKNSKPNADKIHEQLNDILNNWLSR